MTVFLGYHASHEQLPPSQLLAAVQAAERAGFDGAMCSDHLAPWGVAQGESGHTWTWLGAALATTRFTFGTVTAPGQRYHPVVTAQAIATLGELFPGRFWCALGSGEALNEHITGDAWPPKPARMARLAEAADVMRRLLEGERVDHDGAFRAHEARLWSLPEVRPRLIAAAVSASTAAWAADWAEGLVTVGHDPDAVGRVLRAYTDAGGRGIRAVQLHLSIRDTERDAVRVAAEQWRQATVTEGMWDLEEPEDFDRLADPADETSLRAGVLIATDVRDVAERVAALAAAGADAVYLHEVGTDQERFTTLAAQELIPAVRAW